MLLSNEKEGDHALGQARVGSGSMALCLDASVHINIFGYVDMLYLSLAVDTGYGINGALPEWKGGLVLNGGSRW